MNDQSAADAFLSAISARDFGRLAACLAPSAQARMLLPRGPEVRSGRDEIAQRLEGWFAPATEFEVLDTGSTPVGSRTRLNWRFRLSRDGETREVIEQVAFVAEGPDGISEIALLCSGFLKEEEPGASCVFDAGSMGCGDGLAQEFRSRLEQVSVGESLTVIVSDPAAKEDLPSLVRMLGHSVTAVETQADQRLAVTVVKRT
ncbi:MAG TPA: sulfurtransferase TusA family protein [Candidatus Dormibacteraeota bacterium]|jgi:TusA-related sulfurtransferase